MYKKGQAGWCSVCLVMCSAEKVAAAAAAADLYTSARFRRDRSRAERDFDRWYILSGKHGLVKPSALINPYDFDLAAQSLAFRHQWAESVARVLSQDLPAGNILLEIRASPEYRELLIEGLAEFGFRIQGSAEAEPEGLRMVRRQQKGVGTKIRPL